MILFLQDWNAYPTATPHVETKNESFKLLAKTLQKMGVKNWYFMLALHNPAIRHLDPFDPNLTMEQRMMIAYECKTNLWYHIREVARFPGRGDSTPMPFKANRGNIALLWLFLNHITAILIQPRQTGKSGSVDVLFDWIIDINGVRTNVFMLTKDGGLQMETIARIKDIRELLPPYLYQKSKSDSDNKTGLNNTALRNKFLTAVARSSAKQATNLGRGLTTAIVLIDEGPFITHVAIAIPAIQAATTTARTLAKANGSHYGTIFTTTAGRRDDRDGAFMYDFVHLAMPMNEVMYDCKDQRDLENLVDASCISRAGDRTSARVVNITMSHRQLGLNDDWLYEAIRSSGGTREEIERDYFNIWNSGSSRNPLTTEIITRIFNSIREASVTQVTMHNYIMNWYISSAERAYLKTSSKILMGLDTSDAAGRDAIAMVFTDAASMRVVGQARIALANLIDYAKWLAVFLIDNPEVLLIPERKSSAIAIIDLLLIYLPEAGVDPFKRIYNSIVQNAKLSPKHGDAYDELATPLAARDEFFYTSRKTAFGFNTNKELRNTLFGTLLQQAAQQTADHIVDKTLVTEIMGLTIKNDRVDHQGNGHDDHVFAWLMTHWLANYGLNLQHYGIAPGLIMSQLFDLSQADQPFADRWKQDMQKNYMDEIDQLVELLSESDSDAMNALYERKLQMLSRKVEAGGGERDYSVDGIMERIQKERKKRQRVSSALGSHSPENEPFRHIQDMVGRMRASNFRGRASDYINPW